MKTKDGLTVYDLDPQAGELWAVAGPNGFDPKAIDPDNLPDGFRWVEDEEWEAIQADAPRIPVALRYETDLGKWVAESDLYICACDRRIDALAEMCSYHNCTADRFEITVDEI
jgi:hypothetical protein